MNSSRFKNRISRREFLKGIRSKRAGFPILDKEKCTGCGLCAIDCPTRALNMLRLKLPGHRPELPGNEISPNIVPLDPAPSGRPAGHVPVSEKGLYQLVFRHDLCNSCGICERSCPEHCLRSEEDLGPGRIRDGVTVVFEDRMSRCSECDTPLFPQAMISLLKSRMRVATESAWLFDLCPSCRMKAQFEKGRIGKTKG